MKTCKAPNCPLPVFGKGYCRKHQYLREDMKKAVKNIALLSKPKEKPQRTIKQLEGDLWKVFSVFIRLRDADENGFCKCFTCNNIRHWTKMDCGHGVGRQHKATKFDEMNNNAQCKPCNGFEGGRMDVYKAEMDKKYGYGTWDLMLFKSKQRKKWSAFEYETLIAHYQERVRELKRLKNVA